MKSRDFFWFASLCLVLCTVAANSQRLFEENIDKNADFNSDQEWRNKDSSKSGLDRILWMREASSSRRGIDGNKAGCSRYCIKNTGDRGIDSVKRINVIWKMVENSRVTISSERSNSWGRSGSSSHENDFVWEPMRISFNTTDAYSDDDPKCELYIQLGCETRSKPNTSIDELPDESLTHKQLVRMDLTSGYTESEFNVDEFTNQLRILTSGKLSQAILEIPTTARAANSTDARRPKATLSLSRTSGGKGVRLDARNPTSGRWRLKLSGMENSNYSFSVIATSSKAPALRDSYVDVLTSAKPQAEHAAESNWLTSSTQRPVYLKINDEDDASEQSIISDDQQMLVGELLLEEQSVNEPEVLEFSASKGSVVKAEATMLTEKEFLQKYGRGAELEAEMMEPQVDNKIISGRSFDESPGEIAKIVEDSELEELSRSAGEIQTRTKKTVVDISPNAQLIARPGFHDVVFTVTNNQALGIRHSFQGRSTQFPFVGILPNNVLWIRAGETVEVAVRIQVPNSQDSSPGVVTLYVGGTENFEVAEKSTYIYVQGSSEVPSTDNDKPSIDYSFNDNCNGKLNRDRCNRSLWSVEVTVKDSDSGLKTVTSLPKGVEPRTEFIAGTKNSVTFYYVSTCCYTTVDIKATDIQGNVNTRTVDVTDWDNLSQGEIAAIVVGALLILIFIILIILLILYCVRKRKSHDLSYSQRYGSRAPASTERTNF